MGRNLDSSKPKGTVWPWFYELIPLGLVFLFSLLFSFLLDETTASGAGKDSLKIIQRFFRLSIPLLLPLYTLKPFYGFILNRGQAALVQLDRRQPLSFQPLRHWLFRPFQGIGIGFLFTTRLLALLQIISGPASDSSPLVFPGQFQFGRFVLVSLIIMAISLLLTTLWTLDDLGIRYYNRRDQELKMIGKYAGTLMPLVFGLYGLFTLLTQMPKESALIDLLKIVLALYPPMVLLTVIHHHYISGKRNIQLQREGLKKGGIWQE
jgi:hypothetical protein